MQPYDVLKTRTQDADLRIQVEAGVAAIAQSIFDGSSPDNAAHQERAKHALKNPATEIDTFIWQVVMDATVDAAFPAQTDAQVKAVLDAKWSKAWK